MKKRKKQTERQSGREEIYVNEDAEKTVSAPAVEIVDETEN